MHVCVMKKVPGHMQIEVIKILWDANLKPKFTEVDIQEFYKYLHERFEEICKFAYEIISILVLLTSVSNYSQLMIENKSPIKSRLINTLLNSILEFYMRKCLPIWKYWLKIRGLKYREEMLICIVFLFWINPLKDFFLWPTQS